MINQEKLQKIKKSILELRRRSIEICAGIAHFNKKFIEGGQLWNKNILLANYLSDKNHKNEIKLVNHWNSTNSYESPNKLLDEIDEVKQEYRSVIDELEKIKEKNQACFDSLFKLDEEEKEIDLKVKNLFNELYTDWIERAI